MKLHMHFGCGTSLGLKLKVLIEALAVELGLSSQPLQQCYDKYKKQSYLVLAGLSVGEVQQVQN